jgi:hypothetical protein
MFFSAELLLITSHHSIYNKETSMKRQMTSRKNGGQTKRRLKIGCQCNRLLNNKQNVSSLLQTFMYGFYLLLVIYNEWRSALSSGKISIFLWDVKNINCHIRRCMSPFIPWTQREVSLLSRKFYAASISPISQKLRWFHVSLIKTPNISWTVYGNFSHCVKTAGFTETS